MNGSALRTLFHPFEDGGVALPAPGERVLFLGAEASVPWPRHLQQALVAIQGFRPLYLQLRGAGIAVYPVSEGHDFDAALVLTGRHRGENELRIAQAIVRTRPSGLVVIAGSKEDGIASLRKRMADIVDVAGHLPKYHGIAFWFRCPVDAARIAAELQAGAQAVTIDARFRAAPGMFSHDRVDAGSRLLAESLPDNLSGRVADFCAGWGYLASEVAGRFRKVKALDLYEADFASLEAAKANLAEVKSPPLRFFWHDLAGEPVAERYDAIVMNPPFHLGRRAEPELGQAIIRSAISSLKSGGRLFLVANRQLPYEKTLAGAVSEIREIAGNGTFKVLAARR